MTMMTLIQRSIASTRSDRLTMFDHDCFPTVLTACSAKLALVPWKKASRVVCFSSSLTRQLAKHGGPISCDLLGHQISYIARVLKSRFGRCELGSRVLANPGGKPHMGLGVKHVARGTLRSPRASAKGMPYC